jgi:hypothetical protein
VEHLTGQLDGGVRHRAAVRDHDDADGVRCHVGRRYPSVSEAARISKAAEVAPGSW